MPKISRRGFVKSLGAASLAPATLLTQAPAWAADASAKTPDAASNVYLYFNADEAGFIEAACERLIPHDDVGPGALDAGVPNYLDKQLGGSWGAGERLYRSGPWQQGTPSQGYQLPFTPAELFHNALRAILAEFEGKTAFKALSPDQQDAYLKSLEAGGKDLGGVPSALFFQTLLQMTVEGYFSDPIYGGNKDMVAWRMIGFPGAYANYYDLVDKHGISIDREPTSIGSDRKGHIHPDPNVPAKL